MWGTGFYGELGHEKIIQSFEPIEIGTYEILNAQAIICHKNCTAIITSFFPN